MIKVTSVPSSNTPLPYHSSTSSILPPPILARNLKQLTFSKIISQIKLWGPIWVPEGVVPRMDIKTPHKVRPRAAVRHYLLGCVSSSRWQDGTHSHLPSRDLILSGLFLVPSQRSVSLCVYFVNHIRTFFLTTQIPTNRRDIANPSCSFAISNFFRPCISIGRI